MARTDKDIFYDLSILITSVPIGLAGWMESITCEYFLINFGGHFVYDMIIPVSLFVYFTIILTKFRVKSNIQNKIENENEFKATSQIKSEIKKRIKLE